MRAILSDATALQDFLLHELYGHGKELLYFVSCRRGMAINCRHCLSLPDGFFGKIWATTMSPCEGCCEAPFFFVPVLYGKGYGHAHAEKKAT